MGPICPASGLLPAGQWRWPLLIDSLPLALPAAAFGDIEMPLTRKEIHQEIRTLEAIIPHMLARHEGARFWVEFLERANQIKAQVHPLERDWLRAQIGELLSRYNLALPGQEASCARLMNGRVYNFPTGVRIA